jgi:hypothetical protein
MSDFSSISAKRRISLDYQTLIRSSAAIARLLDLALPSGPGRRGDASTAQSQVLFNLGVQDCPQTHNQAEALIAGIRLRQRQELASVKQLAYLVALGVDPGEARRLSMDDASMRIQQILAAAEDVYDRACRRSAHDPPWTRW